MISITYDLVFDDAILNKYFSHYFQLHPKAKVLPIDHPYHPSINQWMIMKRPAMNNLKQKWKDFIVWFVGQQGYANLRIDKCDIEFRTFYYTNRPHDCDNSVPKFILDGLVESGMLVNEDNKHVVSLKLECFVHTERPRTEIKIIEKEENNNG